MRPTRNIVPILLALTFACSPARQGTIESLRNAGDRVAKAAGSGRARVQLHQGTDLFVTVTNSGWSDVPAGGRRAAARQAAEAALDGYDDPSIHSIHVRIERSVEVFGIRVGSAGFEEIFDAGDLRTPPTSAAQRGDARRSSRRAARRRPPRDGAAEPGARHDVRASFRPRGAPLRLSGRRQETRHTR